MRQTDGRIAATLNVPYNFGGGVGHIFGQLGHWGNFFVPRVRFHYK